MRLRSGVIVLTSVALLAASVSVSAVHRSAPHTFQSSQSSGTASGNTTPTQGSSSALRGKKLVLKDGTFQLVREYQKNGDRVRYFSTERADWEELPAALVDWDATKKAETTEEKTNNLLADKVRNQEAAMQPNPPMDVDASLTVASGVFLPDGEGMFAVEGKSVRRIEQVGSQVRTDKKTVLKQVLTPIPIIPSKHNIEIPGARALTRLKTETPEFFLRATIADPDRDSMIERTSRTGDTGPEVILVRAKVKGDKRLIESVRSMFGMEVGQERQDISMQRWDVAPDVYRFTLSQQLPPGEYALAELLPGGMNLFVWDFAVDGPDGGKPGH
jgi:hypothetical protein